MLSQVRSCGVVYLAAVVVKLLLIPAYHSTDFEVHRNWLAITHSVPRGQWYHEATSEWTLDYPPLFAGFEWVLSHAAAWVEPQSVEVSAGAFESWRFKVFHRCTVVAADVVLLAGAAAAARVLCPHRGSVAPIVALVALHPALLIVDGIHFQYNGLLLGLMMLSVAALVSGRTVTACASFAALLCFKHLFLCLAPVFGLAVLRGAAWPRVSAGVTAGVGVVAAAFGAVVQPAVQAGSSVKAELAAIGGRLFPLGRGLLHAYWAPNVWALYAGADRVLRVALRAPEQPDDYDVAAVTKFSVLPFVTPGVSLVGVLAAATVACALFLRRKTAPYTIALGLTASAFSLYQFGWQVHEKAALVPCLCFMFLADHHPVLAMVFSMTVTYAVSPLLFKAAEAPLIVLFPVAYHCVAAVALRVHRHAVVVGVAFSLAALHVVVVGLPFVLPGLQFLPLMLTSLWCGVLLVGVWLYVLKLQWSA